ncbi:MAG: glycosyltransferase family 2 protein [Silanimonas sp.]
MTAAHPKVAVIIPSFRVTRHIVDVVGAIGPQVDAIYVVDDACPDGSGDYVAEHCSDPRLHIVRHGSNRGVGGAVLSGYRAAIADGCEILVKMDGDGQMDAALLPVLVDPILRGDADYTKGNRFWDLTRIQRMPLVRRIGNLGLSFLAKLSTGYWDLFDPTNGYTAIHASVAARLPMASISERYFFETDVLFRLNTLRAAVVDVPMDARYGDETSHLSVWKVLFEFSWKHLRNAIKRIAYNYFLRDWSVASVQLMAAIALGVFAMVFGGYHWIDSARSGQAAAVGTIMIAALAAMSSLQFLLAFVALDVASVPRRALHRLLARRDVSRHDPA